MSEDHNYLPGDGSNVSNCTKCGMRGRTDQANILDTTKPVINVDDGRSKTIPEKTNNTAGRLFETEDDDSGKSDTCPMCGGKMEFTHRVMAKQCKDCKYYEEPTEYGDEVKKGDFGTSDTCPKCGSSMIGKPNGYYCPNCGNVIKTNESDTGYSTKDDPRTIATLIKNSKNAGVPDTAITDTLSSHGVKPEVVDRALKVLSPLRSIEFKSLPRSIIKEYRYKVYATDEDGVQRLQLATDDKSLADSHVKNSTRKDAYIFDSAKEDYPGEYEGDVYTYTKAEMGYVDVPPTGPRCGKCAWFQSPNRCGLVKDPKAPDINGEYGCCNAFIEEEKAKEMLKLIEFDGGANDLLQASRLWSESSQEQRKQWLNQTKYGGVGLDLLEFNEIRLDVRGQLVPVILGKKEDAKDMGEPTSEARGEEDPEGLLKDEILNKKQMATLPGNHPSITDKHQSDASQLEKHLASMQNIEEFQKFVNLEMKKMMEQVAVEAMMPRTIIGLMAGKIIFAAEASIDEPLPIHGILAYAGVSHNRRLYLPEQLARGHGVRLPLIFNHATPMGIDREIMGLPPDIRKRIQNHERIILGYVVLDWKPEELTLFYRGQVEHPFFKNEIREGRMSVSLGMLFEDSADPVCDVHCYTVVKSGIFQEVSLVYHPGFPVASINITEAFLQHQSMESIHEADYATIKRGKQKVEIGSKQDQLLHARDLPHSHVTVKDGDKQIKRYGTEDDENEQCPKCGKDFKKSILDESPLDVHMKLKHPGEYRINWESLVMEEISGPPTNTIPIGSLDKIRFPSHEEIGGAPPQSYMPNMQTIPPNEEDVEKKLQGLKNMKFGNGDTKSDF